MSKLLSVLALSGNKAAALLQAADDVRASVTMMIAHGNARNITDTIAALKGVGAVTKDGSIAKSRKGAILSCLIQAHDEAQSARITFQAAHQGHKGKPSADMLYQAGQFAEHIATAFEERAKLATAPKVKAKAEPKAKAEAATEPKAETETKAAGPVPLTSKGDYDAESLLRVIRAEKRRIAVRDRIIAELRAELAALKLPVSPVKSKTRKAA